MQPRCSTRTGVGQGGGGSGPSSGHMTLVPPSGRGEGRERGVGVTRAWGSLSRGRGGSWPGSEAGPLATTLWNPGPRGQSRRAGRLLTGWHNLSVPRVRGARTLLGKGPAPPGSHPASLPPRFPFPRSRVLGWGFEPLGPGRGSLHLLPGRPEGPAVPAAPFQSPSAALSLKASSRAQCTVRPSQPEHCSLAQRRAPRGDGWLGLKTPLGLRGGDARCWSLASNRRARDSELTGTAASPGALCTWSQRCRGARRGAAHSHRWVQKPIFTQTVPRSSLPKQSRPHRPEMTHKERKALSTKACINLLIGNWLKSKALRLTVSVRLRFLAALSTISEARDYSVAPGRAPRRVGGRRPL